jgi:alkylation response protein AidB-like acyl-CoA dehydrogenase
MEWKLSDEQTAYQAALRDWIGKEAGPGAVRTWLDAGDAGSFEAAFDANGWSGVGIPESVGGEGGGLVELALTAEELGRSAVPSARWTARSLAAEIAPDVTLLVASDGVPHRSSPLTADPDGRITGRMRTVLGGDRAEAFAVPVDGPGGVALRRVAASDTTVTPRALLDRSRSVADVELDSADSTPIQRDAADLLLEASARAAVLIAADSLGAAQRMLDLCVSYAGVRHQFGVPIGSFQAVKHAAATMLVGIEAARSVVYFAAASVDAPQDVRHPDWFLHAAAAKAQVTAEGVRCADAALTLHGAIGFTWEHDLQLFYKRAKLDQPLFGSPAAWNELIAAGLELV